MSTQNVALTRGTWLDVENPNTNHAGESSLKSDYSTNLNKTLLQFTIPNSILYKKIVRCTLNFYFGGTSGIAAYGTYLWPYITTNTSTAITYNNYMSQGTVGEYKNVKYKPAKSVGQLINQDISELFSNNLIEGKFSILLGIGEHYTYISGTGSNAPYLTVEYEDAPVLPPTLIYPKDVYIRQGESIRFSWLYNSSTQAVQSSASLEYKLASSSVYTVVPITGNAQSYLLENGLASGTFDWRVRTTNDISETSAYSSSQFVVVGKPSVPVITTVANKCLTEISWNASDQNAYEITISKDDNVLLHEMVGSNICSYKPQMFLANGVYNVKLRTLNSIDLWSDETNKTFTISASAPATPTIDARVDGANVILKFANAAGTKIAIIRSGEVLDILPDGVTEYKDKTPIANKQYEYVVRAVGDGYADSITEYVTVSYEGFIIQTTDVQVQMMESTESYLNLEESNTVERALMRYVGRQYPVLETGIFKNVVINRSVVLRPDVYSKIKDITGEAFYRDTEGNAFNCAVAVSAKRYMDIGYSCDIEITRLNREAVVINE